MDELVWAAIWVEDEGPDCAARTSDLGAGIFPDSGGLGPDIGGLDPDPCGLDLDPCSPDPDLDSDDLEPDPKSDLAPDPDVIGLPSASTTMIDLGGFEFALVWATRSAVDLEFELELRISL